jgi:hypothetical protein
MNALFMIFYGYQKLDSWQKQVGEIETHRIILYIKRTHEWENKKEPGGTLMLLPDAEKFENTQSIALHDLCEFMSKNLLSGKFRGECYLDCKVGKLSVLRSSQQREIIRAVRKGLIEQGWKVRTLRKLSSFTSMSI